MIANASAPIVVTEYEQIWVNGLNSGNVLAADEAFLPDSIIHINGNPQRDLSLADFKQMAAGLLIAFSDLHFTINDQFVAGEKVSTRWTATGTHTGPLGDIPATGKSVEIQGLIIDHVVDGKVAEPYKNSV